jgi:hypothetical protein
MGRAKLPPNYGTAAPKRLSRLRAFGVALNVVGWLVRGGQNERHQIIDRGIAYMTVMLEAIQKSQKELVSLKSTRMTPVAIPTVSRILGTVTWG